MNPAIIIRGVALAAAAGAAAVATAYRFWPRPAEKQPKPAAPAMRSLQVTASGGKTVVVVCSVRMSDLMPQYMTWADAQSMPGWGLVARHAFAEFLARNHLPFDAACRNEITEALATALAPLNGKGFLASVACDETNNTWEAINKGQRRAQLRIQDNVSHTIYHVWFEFTRHANGDRS